MKAEANGRQLENSQQPAVVKGEKVIVFLVDKELSQRGSGAIVQTLKISFLIIKKPAPPNLIIKSLCPPKGFDAILHFCNIWARARIYFSRAAAALYAFIMVIRQSGDGEKRTR